MLSTVASRHRLIALVYAIAASCAIIADGAHAADAPQVSTQLPDTTHNVHVYLFQFKKNDISLQAEPDQFCTTMDYGTAVYGHRSQKIDGDKVVPGDLDWVICKFPTK